MSADKIVTCEICKKLIEFDVDCQEVIDMGDFTTESCKWVHSDCPNQ